jgi:hypothetical protein
MPCQLQGCRCKVQDKPVRTGACCCPTQTAVCMGIFQCSSMHMLCKKGLETCCRLQCATVLGAALCNIHSPSCCDAVLAAATSIIWRLESWHMASNLLGLSGGPLHAVWAACVACFWAWLLLTTLLLVPGVKALLLGARLVLLNACFRSPLKRFMVLVMTRYAAL